MKHRAPPVPPAEEPASLDLLEPAVRTFDAGREERLVRTAPGTLLIVHAVLAALVQVGWWLLPDGTFGLSKASMEGYAVAAALMQGLCILVPTLVVAGGYRITPRILFGRSLPRPGGIVLAAAAGIPAAVLLTGLNNILLYLLAKAGFPFPAASASHFAATGSEAVLLLVIVGALVPGLVEELMFRGLIQGAMEDEGAKVSAVVLPALAFAFFHADPLFLLAPFGAGLLLGYLRQSSGSLFPAVAAHMSLNLTLIAVRPLLPQWRDASATAGFDADTLLVASLVAVVVALVAAVPVMLAFGSSMYRRSTEPVRPYGAQPVRKAFLEWRFLLGLGILAVLLWFLSSVSLSIA